MTKEKKSVAPSVDNEPFLLEDLKDPEFASEFLNVAIENYLENGDINTFNAVLKSLVTAGNVSQIAKESKISRPQIYRMINGTCEATLPKTLKLLHAIGFLLKVEPIEKSV